MQWKTLTKVATLRSNAKLKGSKGASAPLFVYKGMSMSKKKTHEEIVAELAQKRPDVTLLDRVDSGTHTQASFQCNVCVEGYGNL